jgi:hypothetical protein
MPEADRLSVGVEDRPAEIEVVEDLQIGGCQVVQ